MEPNRLNKTLFAGLALMAHVHGVYLGTWSPPHPTSRDSVHALSSNSDAISMIIPVGSNFLFWISKEFYTNSFPSTSFHTHSFLVSVCIASPFLNYLTTGLRPSLIWPHSAQHCTASGKCSWIICWMDWKMNEQRNTTQEAHKGTGERVEISLLVFSWRMKRQHWGFKLYAMSKKILGMWIMA